jgi:hypothetical protein
MSRKERQTTSNLNDNEFSRKKTDYFATFALQHKTAFIPHRELGGLLRHDSQSDVWRNVAEHCLLAGVMADILAEQLNLDQQARKQVVQAAILHDWHKRHEVAAIELARKNGTFTYGRMQEIWHEDQEKLRAFNLFDEETIRLSGANTPDTIEGPVSDQEIIIWYVDAMLSNTTILPIADRFFNDKRGWDGEKEIPERKQRAYDYSHMFREAYSGNPLDDVQLTIAVNLNNVLSSRIGYTGNSANLPLYLKTLLHDRIISRA